MGANHFSACRAGRFVGACVWLMLTNVALGQTATNASSPAPAASSVPSGSTQQPTELQIFQQEQKTLIHERRALIAQDATQEQLAFWHQQNAVRLVQAQALAQNLSSTSTTTN